MKLPLRGDEYGVIRDADGHLVADCYGTNIPNSETASALVAAANAWPKAVEVLKGVAFDNGFCPLCGTDEVDGHAPDCPLAEALRDDAPHSTKSK